MEELFGLSMTTLMYVLVGVVLTCMAVLGVLAARNRIMLKMGLRPIPRRPGQTALIIMGVMLSTVIMAAAFGTGDTLSSSIRNGAVEWLQEIDELVVPTRAGEDARFGAAYITEERFGELLVHLSANEKIDGIMPQAAESVSVQNIRTGLTEGRMRLVGIDPAMLDGFQGLSLLDGGEARLEDLAPDEVYVSEPSVEELEAEVGDELEVFLEGRSERLKIAGVVSAGGFAGIEPTMVVPLDRAQTLLDRPDQINTIVISNRGDSRTGVDLSEDVTKDLRVLFNDRQVAEALKALFGREDILGALDSRIAELEEEVGESGSNDELDDLRDFTAELRKPELTDELSSLLADPEVTQVVVEQLEEAELDSATAEAYTLLAGLAELQVLDIKRDIVEASEEAGTGVTSIFILFSSFSIMVGILLIFLIFVMLASARKSEMGMARAVGAKRRHLVMMFAFEGYGVRYRIGGHWRGAGAGRKHADGDGDEPDILRPGRDLHPRHTLRAPQRGGGLLPGDDNHLRDRGGVGVQGEPSEHRGRHTRPAGVDHPQGRAAIQGAAVWAAQVGRAPGLPPGRGVQGAVPAQGRGVRQEPGALRRGTALPPVWLTADRARRSQVHPAVPAEGVAGASRGSRPHLFRGCRMGEVFVVRSGCISQCGGAGTDAEVGAWADGYAVRDRRQDRLYGCGRGHACLLGAAGVCAEAAGRGAAGRLRHNVRFRHCHGRGRRVDGDVQLGPAGPRVVGADLPLRPDQARAGDGGRLPDELEVPDGADACDVRPRDLHAGQSCLC